MMFDDKRVIFASYIAFKLNYAPLEICAIKLWKLDWCKHDISHEECATFLVDMDQYDKAWKRLVSSNPPLASFKAWE